jgi:MFS transporter, SP family, sugar:H+ symporter
MPGFLHDFGYANPALPGGYGISTTVQQLITSLVSAGMFVSTMAAGWFCNRFGRRGGLWAGNALMVISVVIQIAATQVEALYVGRLVLGFSNGLLVVCSQLYLQETVPANLRSLSYTFYQFWISFGALLGGIVNNETTKLMSRASYRIPLGVLVVVPVLQSIALIFMPDTPRYYASKDRVEQAGRALRFHRDQAYTDLQLKEEMAEITAAIAADRQLTSEVGYLEMFQHANLRRTLTSLGCALFSAANGVPFIIQYGIYFFLLTGDHNPFQTGVILQCVGLFGAMLTPFFTGRIGKRLILMSGGFGQALCMLGVGLVYSVRGFDAVTGNVIIAMASIFLFIASGTTSPFSWQVAGEIPSQRLRGHTLGFASSITYLCGWSITFTIPYFINPTELNWVC